MAALKQILFWTLVSFMGLSIFSVVFNEGDASTIGLPFPFYSSATKTGGNGTGTVLSFTLNYFIIDLLVALAMGTVITLGNAIIKRKNA